LEVVNQRQSDNHGLLWWALGLTVLFHGALLINQSFYRTYDALIHIFFGSHYAKSWFDPWEPRWYTGFTVFSYPPLAHQLIAAFGTVLDLRSAFAVVQLLALLLLVVGVYRFSRLFVSPFAAGCAALLTPLSSAIVQTVHVYGQLPTTLSLGFLLNALPFAVRFVRGGERAELWRALAWLSATTAAHHITTLFGSVFFAGPVLLIAWLEARRAERPPLELRAAWQQLWYRFAPRTYRLALVVLLTGAALLVTVLPYWLWVRGDPITQTPIPHASRDNFLANPNAGVMFFVIPWASAIWFLPYAVYKSWGWRWPVAASLVLLFVLGTGGTTPLPRLILRGAFDILTLERFTFWAAMLTLPFAGLAVESLLRGHVRSWLEANFGRRIRWGMLGAGVLAMVVCALLISGLTRLRKFQPEPIDAQPIVSFLEKDEHWRYRYLTLGFGDQIAWLSANTRALTPDGNYHSARRLIELTSTPVERLDGAKYSGVPGLGSLEQFLTMPEKFNLKFVFTADTFYDPLLYFSGWQRLGRLENGVVYWERDDIPPLPERLPRPSISLPLRVMWGVLPLAVVIAAFASLRLRSSPARVAAWQRFGVGARWLRLLREDAAPIPEPLEVSPWLPRLNFSKLRLASRWLRLAGLIAVVFGVGATLWQAQPRDTPERVVEAYWDDLDFRRFNLAFERVSPHEGLTLERFLLDQSVRGGLRGNYAKLQRLETRILGQTDDRAVVRVRSSWITSLSAFTQDFTHELERTARGWKIRQEPLSLPRPRDRFAQDAAVAYYRAPRRLTTDTTSAGDVLDRPRLNLVSARLVSWVQASSVSAKPGAPQRLERVLSVVGELENADARPADATVTVLLRDARGAELMRENVGTLMLHKLLPGERTPFRVDFAGVNAPEDLESVAEFEVFAKAVVTERDLERGVAAWLRSNGSRLEGRVYNVGTQDATIPRALLSLYDARGLAWMKSHTLLDAVAPRFDAPLTLEARLPDGYRVIRDRRAMGDGDAVFDAKQRTALEPLRAPLSSTPLTAYRVQMQAFRGQP
jgi:hypothetical protein